MRHVVFMGVLAALVLGGVQPSWAQDKPSVVSSTYRIVTGDLVQITVFGHPEYSMSGQLLTDGTIGHPIFGRLYLVGKTTQQVEQEIVKVLKDRKLLRNPRVACNVTPERREITVGGATRASTKMELKEGWRVLDALGAAGGIGSDRYEFFKAQVIRGGQTIELDLAKIYAGDLAANIALEPGDFVYVLAKDSTDITIQVIGEIARGGAAAIECPRDGSIITVLNSVGGVSELAALAKAKIERKGKTIYVDLRGYKKGRLETAEHLEPGDRLIIPRNEDRYKINGVVGRAGEFPFPEDRELTLFDVLTVSGINLREADLKRVKLTRSVSGQQVTTTHDVSKMLKGDKTQDIKIAVADEIFVPPSKRSFGLQDIWLGLSIVSGALVLSRNLR